MNYAPLLIPANNWMDLLVAADYVGVPYAELVAAATKGELDATVTHPQRPGDWVVTVRPELVVEIAFDGVQTSPRYPGGMALRFARVLRYRPDKQPGEADTVDTVARIHQQV